MSEILVKASWASQVEKSYPSGKNKYFTEEMKWEIENLTQLLNYLNISTSSVNHLLELIFKEY